MTANEGNSAGGHTAIRFDNETFHFQHESSGIIRLQRLKSPTFDHVYAVLGNRPIWESWIEVSAETFTLLLDGFTQMFLIQDEQQRILASLRSDIALFEQLLADAQNSGTSPHKAGFPLRGLGYFLADDVPAAVAHSGELLPSGSQSIRRLKSLVSSVYGENFISLRIAEAQAAIRTLQLHAASVDAQILSVDLYPQFSDSASAAYGDAQAALSALQLLQTGSGLLDGRYWPSSGGRFELSSEESLLLGSFADRLTSDLLQLLNSSRSDWGFPFIVGMARLAVIETSLKAGKLLFLNVFPDSPERSSLQNKKGSCYLPAMIAETERQFELKRQAFFSSREVREADFAALEVLGNKLMELEYSFIHGVLPRQLPDTPLPARPARPTPMPMPAMTVVELQQELEAARRVKKEYSLALASLYGYDLLQRNCVTGIFAYINRILAQASPIKNGTGQFKASDIARAESLQRLGGYVDPSQGLNFIPAISAAEVDACYRVTDKRKQPSYRARRLEEMKKHESSLLVFLRESNTLTSTIYQHPPQDSPFLFFTDDTLLLRPVFGLFNLLTGFGQTLLGLAALPVEGSNRLSLGVKGILFSLPELAFVNLRKGSMEYIAETDGFSSP